MSKQPMTLAWDIDGDEPRLVAVPVPAPVYYLGIDPGLSGALAVLDTRTGGVTLHDVPTRKATRGEVYLAGAMADLLRPYIGLSFCVLEQVSAPRLEREKGSGNITSALKIGQGAGLWEGILAAHAIPYEIVAAAAWKKTLGLVGQDKKASRARAMELFPGIREELLRRRPDFSEALLLAEWSRRTWNGKER